MTEDSLRNISKNHYTRETYWKTRARLAHIDMELRLQVIKGLSMRTEAMSWSRVWVKAVGKTLIKIEGLIDEINDIFDADRKVEMLIF